MAINVVRNKKLILKIVAFLCVILLVWVEANSQYTNFSEAFLAIFTSVFMYFFVFFLGLMYFLFATNNKKNFCYFENIRYSKKEDKVKILLKRNIINTLFYVCVYWTIAFMILFIKFRFNIGVIGADIQVPEYQNLINHKINVVVPIILIIARYLLLAVVLAVLSILSEIILKKFYLILVVGIVLLSCCVDFCYIPVLSMAYIGVNFDFLQNSNVMDMLQKFAIDNIYLMLVCFILYEMSVMLAKRIDLNRI